MIEILKKEVMLEKPFKEVGIFKVPVVVDDVRVLLTVRIEVL